MKGKEGLLKLSETNSSFEAFAFKLNKFILRLSASISKTGAIKQTRKEKELRKIEEIKTLVDLHTEKKDRTREMKGNQIKEPLKKAEVNRTIKR